MKTIFALGAASLAIAGPLAGTAQAQILSGGLSVEGTTSTLLDGTKPDGGTQTLDKVVSPYYGNIDPFYGNIDPFYGNIDPFYGDIGAFYKDISPFYGDIGAFYGDIGAFYGDISPFYGDIGAFWGNIDAFYGDIGAFDADHLASVGQFGSQLNGLFSEASTAWSLADKDPAALATLHGKFGAIYDLSEAQWGAAVTAATAKSFYDGFAAPFYAKHNFNPEDQAALLAMTPSQRAMLFMDWHDSLMEYAGVDHVDHWMGAINWTPTITQEQGKGRDTTIGIIDASLSGDDGLIGNVLYSSGFSTKLSGHGAGVASLLYGAHDGKGVMGIAPGVKVVSYNPFDETGSASWTDITNGVVKLKSTTISTLLSGSTGASIINLSLGERGWTLAPGIKEVFNDSRVAGYRENTVYVIAAGNDGVSQTANLDWNFANDPAMIIVGSVAPNGQISQFSNRPGTACLLNAGTCQAGNRLYMRTIVAPGEMLLMSDGQGGLVRRSGTSFAAPLVSGAVSLLHDRWPWLANYAKESVDIILRSATDLGDPGPDPVYGWGMLNVAASQSPLNFNNVSIRMYDTSGRRLRMTRMKTSDVLAGGMGANWQADGVFFTMEEPIGRTYRDFNVPMSSTLYGMQTNATGAWQTLQSYIAGRFENWVRSRGSDSNGDGVAGLTELRSTGGKLPGGWNLRYDAMAPMQSRSGDLAMKHAAATLTDPKGRMSVTVGYGQGATALSAGRFGMAGDTDRYNGGVNPVLGFASGETFMAASYRLGDKTSVRVGFSDNTSKLDELPGITSREELALSGRDAHKAHAFTVDVTHQVVPAVSVNAQFTHLTEDAAMLGTQSTMEEFMGRGAKTDAMTLAASVDLGEGVTFDLSATAARSAMDGGQAFATPDGVWSSAAQAAIGKRGVFGKNDGIRLSLAQPLNIERGKVEFSGDVIVDRQTGEWGRKTYSFDIGGKRRLVGEAVYAAPLGDTGELGFFGRYESGNDRDETENYLLGGRYSVRF